MRHLIFDTETTNLVENFERPLTKQPQIIEFFGLVLGDDLEEIETYHSYFKPTVAIMPIITKITGLTDEKLADAPRFADKAIEIRSLVEKCDVAVAHNASYDRTVVDFELKRAGSRHMQWPRVICTVESTEYIKGFRLSLAALHLELFGEAFEGAHRAEHDVRATARCYVELVRRGEI